MWCYTTDRETKWDYCNVPDCEAGGAGGGFRCCSGYCGYCGYSVPGLECQNIATHGEDYTGRAYTTSSGLTCKQWSDTKYSSIGDHNYCRWVRG